MLSVVLLNRKTTHFMLVFSLIILSVCSAPAVSFAKLCGVPTSASAQNSDLSTYVSNLFDELQCHWEAQVFEGNEPIQDTTVKLRISPDGKMTEQSVQVIGSSAQNPFTESFIHSQRQTSWAIPGISPQELEVTVKVTPTHIKMLEYNLIDTKTQKEDALISYSPSIAPQAPEAVSLLYIRSFPPGTAPSSAQSGSTSQSTGYPNADIENYIETIKSQIASNWRLVLEKPFKKVITNLMIDRDGKLLSLNIVRSSGSRDIDKAALATIQNAGPFPEVPTSIQSLPLTIDYIFEPAITQPNQ